MDVLSVTIDDLRAFHAKHFPHAPAPEHILYGVEPEAQVAEEYYDEADDGLGYYPDGTKRTLTDEQIAMFRHSEIQAILRKRRLRKEDGEISDAGPTSTVPALVSAPTKDSSLRMTENVDTAQSDAIEKPKQQWATTSAASKAKAKRKRDKYAKRRKEKRLERGLPRRRGGRNGADGDDSSDEESDEWDPWHQAHGPDVQKDDTLDLDY
ncbi:hypothetical protein P3342_001557 [Pyrenophora teres f. teres]|uniref:DUF3807 domain containing protein n=1 Tax=Pyrenophora teres f. teres TaxID=97479 RepID=A0A6S6VRV0_9PLEO|nr:hypothetical protein HRS9139_09959 [Pyrenophora teres f. teres]KAE8826251.1 hypothetical protein PTNB85_09196 [Pyrenophora teres f. teres]KAE8832736.1 hypothetical protein HRS9122_08449 [Pyrenophora teres f. teres]KAE8852689.1 hypothetical protein PTNB29_10079 [Pyrenophora teres f. teres]KAE8854803.1 hypothetical protein PTNB73_10233 [Pyrenophora teres f. teres]